MEEKLTARAKYQTDKKKLFPKFIKEIELEESAEERAEDTTSMLKSISSTGYVHKDYRGHFQSKEFGFIGTQKEKARRTDEGRTSYSIQKTQEKTG